MIKRYHNILFLLVIIILGCEKDDICIEGSENTSRITIGFIDYENNRLETLRSLSRLFIADDDSIGIVDTSNIKLDTLNKVIDDE